MDRSLEAERVDQPVVFVVTLDQGKFARQALYQIKSIRENASFDEIFVYITEGRGSEELPAQTKRWLADVATVVTGPVPIDDYPLSAKTRASVEASDRFPNKVQVVLDSDLLILDDIPVPSNAELAMTPVNVGSQKWGRYEMQDEWNKWRKEFGIKKPEHSIKSTIDRKSLPFPMYNVGVMVIKPKEFAVRWEKVRDKMYDELGPFHFLHQISASLLAADYQVSLLEENYNYPANLRFFVHKNVKVLHYHNLFHLNSLNHLDICNQLSRIKIKEYENSTMSDYLKSLLATLDTRLIPNDVSSIIRNMYSVVK